MKIFNTIFLCFIVSNQIFASGSPKYAALGTLPAKSSGKHSQSGKDKAEKFRTEYRAEFSRIWRDQKKMKAEYQSTQSIGITKKIPFEQFVFDSLKQSYKDQLRKHYPKDPLLQPTMEQSLENKAYTEAMYFVEEGTFCGSCWLCSSDVK